MNTSFRALLQDLPLLSYRPVRSDDCHRPILTISAVNGPAKERKSIRAILCAIYRPHPWLSLVRYEKVLVQLWYGGVAASARFNMTAESQFSKLDLNSSYEAGKSWSREPHKGKSNAGDESKCKGWLDLYDLTSEDLIQGKMRHSQHITP